MTVDGGNLDGVAEAKRIEFIRVRVRVAGLVALVDGQHDRLFRPLEHGRDLRVRGGQADRHVDDHDDDRRRLNGDLRLTAHEFQHFTVRTRLDAAGVHQREGAPAPFAVAVNSVPGDAGGVLYDGGALPCEFIEKHGFAHIGPPDNGDQRFCHGNTSFPYDGLSSLL